jgi:hypothetical protein
MPWACQAFRVQSSAVARQELTSSALISLRYPDPISGVRTGVAVGEEYLEEDTGDVLGVGKKNCSLSGAIRGDGVRCNGELEENTEVSSGCMIGVDAKGEEYREEDAGDDRGVDRKNCPLSDAIRGDGARSKGEPEETTEERSGCMSKGKGSNRN